VIDKVEVKTIAELSPNEIEAMTTRRSATPRSSAASSASFTTGTSTESDTVTLIRFSAIKPSYGF